MTPHPVQVAVLYRGFGLEDLFDFSYALVPRTHYVMN